MEKKDKRVIIVSIVALAIVLITVTYAYFSARITGLENASTISMTAGRMGIVYSEGDENISVNDIYPRNEAWITKTFTLTGYNTTNEEMKYDLGINIISNTFTNSYLTYDLRLVSSDSGTPIETKTGKYLNGTGYRRLGIGSFTTADGDKHTYELKIYFKDNGKDQNDAQGAVFNAKISVKEYLGPIVASNPCYVEKITSYDIGSNCTSYLTTEIGKIDAYSSAASQIATTLCNNETFSYGNVSVTLNDIVENPSLYGLTEQGLIDNNVITNVEYERINELTPGFEYTKGQYTYIYKKSFRLNSFGMQNLDDNGWSVVLTDLYNSYKSLINDSPMPLSTASVTVTTKLCTSVNDEPIISMNGMFAGSQATSIDLSSFDTSNVTTMAGMFSNSSATTLDLSTFDTSNVIDMTDMFKNSEATSIDLSSFDTSKLTEMNSMFSGSQATSLDLSTFDTSNITSMQKMFENCQATSIDLSTFDTSNVTDMTDMFSNSQATSLDLSRFDTSNVTIMQGMFGNSKVTNLDLSSFDTSKVINMNGMFAGSQATSINLNSFNTSNVTDMTNMFYSSQATSLDLSRFDTSNVTSMQGMFRNSKVTNLDLSRFDTSNVTSMHGMFGNSKVTNLDLSHFDTSKVSNMSRMFEGSSSLTTIYVSSRFVFTNILADDYDHELGSIYMFNGATNLVGGAGTTYNSSKTNKEYARIDGGTSNPGYFTDIADKTN